MKRVLIALAAIVLLLVAVVLVGGAVLPREHVAATAVTLHQPLDSVWVAVRDFAALPQWWGDAERVERSPQPDGREVWTHHLRTGSLAIAVESENAPHRLVTRIVADESAAFGGTWTYDLVAVGDATRVTVTENGYINNLVFRFLANTVFGVHATADGYLRALARRYGEDAEPEHVR